MDEKKLKQLKKFGTIAFIIFCIMFALFLLWSFFINPYRGTVKNKQNSLPLDYVLSKKEAQKDLKYMMNHLITRHPLWLEKPSQKRASVESQYKIELASIKDTCTVLELYKALSRIASKLNDGHTYINWVGEKSYYINDFTQLKELGVPILINGIETKTVLETFKTVFSYELDFYAEKVFVDNVLCNKTYLNLCNVDTTNGVTMTFNCNGEKQNYHYNFVPIQDVIGYEVEEEKPFVSYKIDKENNIGIFSLTSCVCDETYMSVLEMFFREVFDNNIENITVDLRGNGGGNSWVANEFFKYLDIEEYKSWDSEVRYGYFLLKNKNIVYTNNKKPDTFCGNLFVLTDTKTYSAAMDFAMMVLDNNLGLIVGEPSGNLPDSYGDVLSFKLPASKLSLGVSYIKWYRIDKTKQGKPLMPDYQVESKDALNKVYELVKNKEYN